MPIALQEQPASETDKGAKDAELFIFQPQISAKPSHQLLFPVAQHPVHPKGDAPHSWWGWDPPRPLTLLCVTGAISGVEKPPPAAKPRNLPLARDFAGVPVLSASPG